MSYRSLAYRIQTPTRSIVISGDTAYSPGLVQLARDADLFVCEVIDLSIYDAMMAQAKAAEAKGTSTASRGTSRAFHHGRCRTDGCGSEGQRRWCCHICCRDRTGTPRPGFPTQPTSKACGSTSQDR